MSKIYHAQEFARKAHEGISRVTYSGAFCPQILHIQEVADLVWASGGNEQEIVAAWLHDTVEDTNTTINDIEKTFGKGVSEIVYGLTDLHEIENLPVSERKAKQAIRVRNESNSVKRIKLADQTSNVRFVTLDPPTTMDKEECRNYVIGAKLIADECKGVSKLLDEMFDRVYRLGKVRYSIE